MRKSAIIQPPVTKPFPESTECFADWFRVSVTGDRARVEIFADINGKGFPNLVAATAKAKVIDIVACDSSGGCAVTAMNLWFLWRNRVATASITKKAYSAALVPCLAAKRIRMERQAKILIHSPSTFIFGGPDDLLKEARQLRRSAAQLQKVLMEKTECDRELVRGWLAHDTYLTAEAALKFGIANEVYDQPEAPFVPQQSPAPTASITPPPPTADEQFFYDLLRALPRLTVRNRGKFLNEVCAGLFYNTDEAQNTL